MKQSVMSFLLLSALSFNVFSEDVPQWLLESIEMQEYYPCNNACKFLKTKTRNYSAYYYCLPTKESTSGWGWVHAEEGNPDEALPLCECPKTKYASCS